MTDAPDHGARFEILRESDAYAVVVHEAGVTYTARVTISIGAVETTWTPEPPRWIADTANGFMKTLQKNHAADATWPSRLVRWRSARA